VTKRYIETIASELGIRKEQVRATAALLADGGTVPFIARYRKEATGMLDEVAITAIRDRMKQLEELDKRRDAILESLKERELLTDELEARVLAAGNMTALEDVYLPYRPKRRTRATIAREKGLEPLAELVMAQDASIDPLKEAEAYINEELDVKSAAEALAGARDIIAEQVNEDQGARERLRELFFAKSELRTRVIKGKEDEGAKYRDYFDFSGPAAQTPSHRMLAMRRAENEGIIYMRMLPPEEEALAILEGIFVRNESPAAQEVRSALTDGYKRLLAPSLEAELRIDHKRRADEEAIRVFTKNLRQLLLSPPLGQKTVMALDPGFRTGCKVVCLDRQGKLLHTGAIFPHTGEKAREAAARDVRALCEKFAVEAIAIGNGTAGRETMSFVKELGLPSSIQEVLVNESGASIYSTSEAAREEFPEHDATVRGSVSIGRRLIDPLAELVKIDPKSIGVGQYQHDVDQSALRTGLDDTVMSCVNAVGVEVNTASRQLLTYVSGLGPTLAANIVKYRDEYGPFRSRKDILNVPRLGPKAFEQAAGFLRIIGAENPLDASAVHPESYHIVEQMAKDLGRRMDELVGDKDLRGTIQPGNYVSDTVGLPTINDILDELQRPGRDPRKKFEAVEFAEGVEKLEDLRPGMKLPGVVTNITNFGAFVDVGVHQDGLVHISQLADRFVKDPATVVSVHQKVQVTVMEVDIPRRRIALSMRSDSAPAGEKAEAKSSGEKPEKRSQKPDRKADRKGQKEQKPKRREPMKNNPLADAMKGLKK
jgi:uncharacterized protein